MTLSSKLPDCLKKQVSSQHLFKEFFNIHTVTAPFSKESKELGLSSACLQLNPLQGKEYTTASKIGHIELMPTSSGSYTPQLLNRFYQESFGSLHENVVELQSYERTTRQIQDDEDSQ